MQSRIHDAMTGEQRLLLALELSYLTRELAKTGIRNDHPNWTERQVTKEFLRSLPWHSAPPVGL
ncbi:MAG TPA: hypothetical protein VNW97_11525 [Candidatus Saccharimonadales bacterium]|nr:hypothetical protein [Candidatus Saccharimonadales bacterium]